MVSSTGAPTYAPFTKGLFFLVVDCLLGLGERHQSSNDGTAGGPYGDSHGGEPAANHPA